MKKKHLPILLALAPMLALGQNSTTFEVQAVGKPVAAHHMNKDLRSLPRAPRWRAGMPIREIPRRTRPAAAVPTPKYLSSHDPLAASQKAFRGKALQAFTTPLLNQNGMGYTGVEPPDTVGDVGTQYFIQAINGNSGAEFAVYNKTDGTLVAGPLLMQALAPAGHACASGLGDPIVLYDQAAGRWFLQEFSQAGNYMCIYISQSGDPVGGGWYFYGFQAPSFPDYPHFGVWPDAYYGTANENNAVYAFDRTNMLTGTTARPMQRVTLSLLDGYAFQTGTPADWDGNLAPATGYGGLILRHVDEEAHSTYPNNPGTDLLEIYQFSVDFDNAANSALVQLPNITITDFNSWLVDYTTFNSVPQPNSTIRLDPIREVILNRLQYRNFGSHEALVGVFPTNIDPNVTGSTVNAGLRWFELRRNGGDWALYQEGTFDPGTSTQNRFVGSLALDGSGNIALAYSLTDTSTTTPQYPSLYYTGRLGSDLTGVMTQGETLLASGTSAGNGRWGDYAAMAVDPVDECTFWFTSQYQDGNWNTRIASFRFDACGSAGFYLAVQPQQAGVCTINGQASFTGSIDVFATGGFNNPVTLAQDALTGFSTTFGTNPVTPGGNSTITLTVSDTVAAGAHTVTYTGTASGANPATSNLLMQVDNALPPPVAGLSPVDGSSGIATNQTQLSWDPITGATGYLVEISDDPAFSTILESANTSGTSYRLTQALSANTTYYWRVRSSNHCGTGPATTASFTTAQIYCTTTPVAIPDNVQTGADSLLTVNDNLSFENLKVLLRINHTWPGDLTATLSHNGSSITLATRMGGTNCSTDNVDAIFTDQGQTLACQGVPPGISGDIVPEQSLKAFSGMSLGGDWVLNVSDNAAADTGSIIEFCLLPDNTPLFRDSFE